MADVRTFEPGEGEGLQKLVREALGETVRPVTPGGGEALTRRDEDPAPSAADLPTQVGETILFEW
ncbi:MAG TPA: hypothetical protein PKE40_02440 [Arachnia sp.]|nr:hypothetical protein [Arachnia sp.]HMT85188.1 hypothetical protein [Arachnia sp.]